MTKKKPNFGSPVLDALREKAIKEHPKNQHLQDLSVCPHCSTGLFYHTDGARVFCANCRRELRNNINFRGGKLIGKITLCECKCHIKWKASECSDCGRNHN